MPEITKRRIQMRNTVFLGVDDKGENQFATSEAVDYVRPDFLDAYVADARARWQYVHVGDGPDAGPGGYEGQTVIPATLDHPEAGKLFPAEDSNAVESEVAQVNGGGGSGLTAQFLTLQAGLSVAVLAMLAAIQTNTMKNTLSDAYKAAATHGALYTTAPGASAGTEVSGGSPAYARKALSWSASSAGVTSVTVTFDVPSGTTVVGAGVHTAITAGTYLDGASVTSQNFASQGTYQLTFTYTQT